MQQQQDRIGQILGNYRLVKLLGKGGYAEAYLAENIHLGIQAAIKVLKARELQDFEQEQFRTEAKLIATLKHPHIVEILDYGIEVNKRGVDGSTPYLVMEYAPLGTLRNLYPHGTPMPLPKVISYVKQIAEALQFAHDHTRVIVHRDVKPENMLVRKPDDVALSDFGIAITDFATGNLQLQIEQIVQKMARKEEVLVPGTAPYIAPERLLGQTQRASDQYSLAVVTYEWLCGYRPFDGKNDLEICNKHITDPPPPICQVFPNISREVERVILTGLAKKPGDRYTSVQAFALALEEAVRSFAVPKSPRPQVVQRPAPPPTPGGFSPSVPPVQTPTYIAPPQTSPPVTPYPIPPVIGQPPTNIAMPGQEGRPPWNARGEQGAIHLPGTSTFRPNDFTFSNIEGASVHQQQQPKGDFAEIVDELKKIVDEPTRTIKRVLDTDRFFLKKNRWFRPLGTVLNILSALIILFIVPIPSSLWIATLGGVLSVMMLWRCVISVKKPIAIIFGAGVALWWGYVVSTIVALSHSAELPAFGFFFAFVVSFGIHAWFVDNRLKN